MSERWSAIRWNVSPYASAAPPKSEDTTRALLRDVAQGRLDLAVTFCASDPPEGVVVTLLLEEPALVHMPAGHRLADRTSSASKIWPTSRS